MRERITANHWRCTFSADFVRILRSSVITRLVAYALHYPVATNKQAPSLPTPLGVPSASVRPIWRVLRSLSCGRYVRLVLTGLALRLGGNIHAITGSGFMMLTDVERRPS